MKNFADSVQTFTDGAGAWWVGGHTTTGYVDANAICFDAASDVDYSGAQFAGSSTAN